jgi:predicted dehydrogenase
MNTPTRRRFMQTGSLAASALAFPSIHAQDSGKKLRLGLIGPGGMGTNHLKLLAKTPDVELAWVCDVDAKRLELAAKTTQELSVAAPKTTRDLREVLGDKSVDAVFIATPDHWHAPATLLALDAGKHVYVEKPCSHTLHEGRLMVDAARKAERVVQVGTQSRSTEHVMTAMTKLHEGAIGEVLSVKVWNSQFRGNIGHVPASEPPAELDFDTWLGPAPRTRYHSNMLPSKWRWFFSFGEGDIGNDGVHDIDIGRWGLGVDTHPSRIAAIGGKFFHDDDQEWPDTQNVIFEYHLEGGKKKLLTYEQRLWSDYHQEGFENGDAFYGTNGYMILGKAGGWRLYDKKDKLREEGKGSPDLGAHHRDFFDCIRGGGTPHADILEGHLSASLCHLANISTKVGRMLTFDPKTERITGDGEADKMLTREYREHWGRPKI